MLKQRATSRLGWAVAPESNRVPAWLLADTWSTSATRVGVAHR